jgi:hypothetical protein
LKEGCIVGSLCGSYGFNIEADIILKDKYVTIFSLSTLPWVCSVLELGKKVNFIDVKR